MKSTYQKKLKIAVGTTSDPKIKYLKEVLQNLKIKADLTPLEVKSGVSEQPKTTNETQQGSINRAKGAFEKFPKSDFSIGIEVGYHKEENGYEMFCWVTIIDKDGYQISSQSHKFFLPKYYQEVLNKGLEMSVNLEGYMKNIKAKNYSKKHIDEIVRHRKPFIENALKNALIQYLNKEDF
ncbi:MAG: inosine/xanthosine triphosphatase [Candidatus Azambacteria bacterium]|nr:inosine/xanthosine triphosphatase [Candidatus Azambacteria bacterium]